MTTLRSEFRLWIACLSFAFLLFVGAFAQTAVQYEIDVHADAELGVFDGHLNVLYTNATPAALSEIVFRLFANDSVLYGGAFLEVTELIVQSTSLPIATFVDDTLLIVPLEPTLPPGDEIRVRMSFHGQAEPRLPSRLPASSSGSGFLTQSASAWTLTAFYPIVAHRTPEGWALSPSPGFGDLVMADASQYTVHLTTQRPLRPVTSAEVTARVDHGPLTTYTFRADNVREFSLVLVDESAYSFQSARLGEIQLETVFLAAHEAGGRRALDLAVDALALYERLIGPCPYERIVLVDVPLNQVAAMEFSGLILVGSEYAAQPDSPFFPIIVSHEMAHQWFYGAVGSDVIEHPWLDEAFATYFSYEFLSAFDDPWIAESQPASWRTSYEDARRDHPELSVAHPVYAFPDIRTYAAFVYDGGALLLHRLRSAMGERCFYQAVQSYHREHRFDVAMPEDLLHVLRRACDQPLNELLEAFDLP
jgi:hypothetical protein